MPSTLELGTGEQIREPTPQQIEQALRSLPGGDGSFAILYRSETAFIQVAGGGAAGFELLEYSDGSPDQHWKCLEDLTTERVVAAFLQYRAGRDDHKQQFQWRPWKSGVLPISERVVKVVGFAIIAWLVWFFARMLLPR